MLFRALTDLGPVTLCNYESSFISKAKGLVRIYEEDMITKAGNIRINLNSFDANETVDSNNDLQCYLISFIGSYTIDNTK